MIRSLEKYDDIGNRTRDIPACSIVPQPNMLPRTPVVAVAVVVVVVAVVVNNDFRLW
jgi:hypothetical protein